MIANAYPRDPVPLREYFPTDVPSGKEYRMDSILIHHEEYICYQ